MLNDQTKSLIAEFFFTLAKGETIIESIRQNLNSYPDFDPFLLYNRLDSARKNFLTEENIINFTKLKNIACSLNQARYLILFYDSTGTQNITYNEFLNLVLNKNYYHQNRMTTTNIENENDNYVSYETEEKFLELLNEEINLIIALDQILSNIKSFGDFSVNELMNMIGSNGKVIEKKINAFLQNYGKNLNEEEIKNLLRILDLKRNGKVDTQDLDRIFYFPYTTPPPFKNNNNNIINSNFNNSNLSNSNNNLNINIENNNNIPNNFPPKNNNFSLKGSFNQNFNNSQQFNNNQPFNKNKFFTNPNPCNDSNYTNFRHNVSPQPFQPKKKINQSLYSSQSTKFNSSMNNNSNKFRQQFYSPPQRNNYVPFKNNLNINIQNSNFNKRNQYYDPCKDPCYDPCKDPCVNVNNNYDPCKDPCYDPCKDLINNNNNIISSNVNNNYVNNNNNNYYDPCQEVYDPCKDIINNNNNNINNNYYVNNQMNKNFNQSGYKNINNSNISFNNSNQTNYSRNNRFFGNPNEFPIRVSKTLALRLSPQRKVKNQNNSFSNEYDNQMNMNNSINNNMNMNSFSQQQNTFTQNDFNNFIQLIMHYETLIECKKLELACNYPDYNVEDLFSLFESPQTQNDILSFQDLRNGFCNLGFNISNEDLNIFIKRYNLECVNGISYSDFFDIVVPFDKIKRDEIENRNDNILTNQTVEKFKELIDLIFTAERAIEDERIRINNLNGFNLGLVFNGERKFEGNCANDDDLEDFLKRKGISFDQKGADLLFIRLDRNRDGCVGVCDFCYEFEPKGNFN
jgi:Ca2+-binding EF-hand superfamily protein